MKTKTKEVYYCDHCKKHGLSKHAMIYHETICSSNPINYRPCMHCPELKKKKIVHYEYAGDNDYKVNLEVFYCNAKNIYLYPPKVEVKNNQLDFAEINEPMPKQCEIFDKMNDDLKY